MKTHQLDLRSKRTRRSVSLQLRRQAGRHVNVVNLPRSQNRGRPYKFLKENFRLRTLKGAATCQIEIDDATRRSSWT